MKLTDLDVERCMSPTGGFKAEVIRILGEDVSMKGWRTRLRGKEVSQKDYDEARAVANLPRLSHVQFGECKGQRALF